MGDNCVIACGNWGRRGRRSTSRELKNDEQRLGQWAIGFKGALILSFKLFILHNCHGPNYNLNRSKQQNVDLLDILQRKLTGATVKQRTETSRN